jgi:predicted acetyltransferase
VNDNLRLVPPNKAMRAAYCSFSQEFRTAGEEIAGSGGEMGSESDFEEFVDGILQRSKGKGLPEGYVPASAFWLVRDQRILGTVDIRHRLSEALRDFGGHIGYSVRPSERRKGYGTQMLALALQEARRLGISRALVTCDRENIASARVIRNNGGVLDSESHSSLAGRVTQRYWIELGEGEDDEQEIP